MQYYLHNFLVEQPDLNFHNPEVRQRMLEIVRYWLDRGVDGFRLDTVNFYFHDKELRDNPPLDPEHRNDNTAPSVNPYNFQDHLYDKTQPENVDFLRALRKVIDDYPGITSVGEVGESQRGTHVQAEYTSGSDKLHMCYDFDFLSSAYPTGTRIAEVMDKIDRIVTEGWPCWAFSNHDVVRWPTRWHMTPPAVRVYAALLLSMRGSVCLYQGEELGLTEAYVSYEDLQDPYGKRFWPKFKGRDGCRTPFPWAGDSTNGGFSDVHPWLPVALEHLPHAANMQDHDSVSMLNLYRRMIAFRRDHAALVKGTQSVVDAAEDRLTLLRAHNGVTMACRFNLSAAPQPLDLPDGDWRVETGAPFAAAEPGGTLGPWQACFATRQD